LWRRRESNTAQGMWIESDRALLSEGSAEKAGAWEEGDRSISVERRRVTLSCSNVARFATEALAALDAGRIDLARERMAALVIAIAA
jgi:hypothetical protein